MIIKSLSPTSSQFNIFYSKSGGNAGRREALRGDYESQQRNRERNAFQEVPQGKTSEFMSVGMRLKFFNLIFYFFFLLITTNCSSSASKPSAKNLSNDDKVLYQIGECSRSRYNNVASSCLDNFKTHVFKGKVLQVQFAYSGVKSTIDLGTTLITCHSHPNDQNFRMLKELLIGDQVVVNGVPDQIFDDNRRNNLILRNCLLLPVRN